MTVFTASVRLLDDNEKRTIINVSMGDISDTDLGLETITAAARLAAWITDLKAITLANVERVSLKIVDPNSEADSGVPSTGSDISEELVLVCHTNDTSFPLEVDRLRVPSPVDTVWVNDLYQNGYDEGDTLAAALVDNFDTALEFSDGEHINTSEGTDGIAAGHWRSRKMRVKTKPV